MSNSSESRPDNGHTDSQPEGHDQERTGHSGEGAASALAQLKTQTRQHRRLGGDVEDPSGGSSQ
jgi:hypothetical protein